MTLTLWVVLEWLVFEGVFYLWFYRIIPFWIVGSGPVTYFNPFLLIRFIQAKFVDPSYFAPIFIPFSTANYNLYKPPKAGVESTCTCKNFDNFCFGTSLDVLSTIIEHSTMPVRMYYLTYLVFNWPKARLIPYDIKGLKSVTINLNSLKRRFYQFCQSHNFWKMPRGFKHTR